MANNFPALRPSLNLDFAGMRVLDPRITLTRASASGGYYDGRTFVKAEENLFLQSQTFETTWGDVDILSTISANSTVAPDGTLTADTITEPASGTGGCGRQQSIVHIASSTYAISCHVKDVDRRYFVLTLHGAASNYAAAEFDLTGASVSRTSVAGTGWSVVSSSIVSAPNGFYRCVLIVNTGTTVSTPRARLMLSDGVTAFNTSGYVPVTASSKALIFWGAQMEQRASVTAYTATTTQPITKYQPKLLTVAANQPVFDHNPVTGEALGLRVEEARTNLLTYSEQFDNAAWSKTNSAVTSNQVIAPDGTLTADKLVGNATLNGHNVQRGISLTSGVSYTFSVCAKKAGTRYLVLRFVAGGAFSTNYIVSFDLDNGTATNNVSFPATSFKVEDVGNGFYRCSITQAASSSAVGTVAAFLSDNGSDTTYLDDGYSGIFIWGAQLEAGAFATSYIKTEASQVTRAADSAVMTGVNFSSWYRQDEGALFAEGVFSNAAAGTSSGLAAIKSSSQNAITIGLAPDTGGTSNTVRTNDVEQASFFVASTAGLSSRVAMAYKLNDIALSVNGAAAVTDTVAILPIVDALYIGENRASGKFNGTIKRITYYPKRLTNAELQAVTR